MASSAVRNNDKVGLIIFSDTIEKFVAPRKGRKHILRVVRELLFFSSSSEIVKTTQTDIAIALEYMNQILKRRSTVFLISDFMAEQFEKDLQIAKSNSLSYNRLIVLPQLAVFPALFLSSN